MDKPASYNREQEAAKYLSQVRRNLKALGLGLIKLSETLNEPQRSDGTNKRNGSSPQLQPDDNVD